MAARNCDKLTAVGQYPDRLEKNCFLEYELSVEETRVEL